MSNSAGVAVILADEQRMLDNLGEPAPDDNRNAVRVYVPVSVELAHYELGLSLPVGAFECAIVSRWRRSDEGEPWALELRRAFVKDKTDPTGYYLDGSIDWA